MIKKLTVKADECIGCHLCLLNCAFSHENIYSEKRARLRLESDHSICLSRPVICRQCKNAECVQACPEGALFYDQDGLVVVDESLCSGCGACVQACPFQVMMFDEESGRVFKCDLCGGEPACVRCCPTGALLFSEVSK